MFHVLQEVGAKRKVSITWVAVLCQFSIEILRGSGGFRAFNLFQITHVYLVSRTVCGFQDNELAVPMLKLAVMMVHGLPTTEDILTLREMKHSSSPNLR